MTLKQEHYIFVLLGIGAAATLYMLVREHAGASAAPAAADAATPTPAIVPEGVGQTYPSVPPIQLGDVILNETPPFQNYNLTPEIPTIRTSQKKSGDGCCSKKDDCAAASTLVNVRTISSEALQAAQANLDSANKWDKFSQGGA